MSEDMPEDMPEEMPGRVPEDMPDRMPDRMPEDMSARMPEDSPVTKRINVMVGITRSKVFFATTFSKPLDADSYQDVLAKGSTHRESQMIVAGFVSNSPSCI